MDTSKQISIVILSWEEFEVLKTGKKSAYQAGISGYSSVPWCTVIINDTVFGILFPHEKRK